MTIERRVLPPRDNFSLGYNFFVAATKETSAQITPQGAYIAARCQKEGVRNPRELGEALLADTKTIRDLVETARIVHEKMNARVRDSEVYEEKMRQVIHDDFEIASRLLHLSPGELRWIYVDLHLMYPGVGREIDIQKVVQDKYGVDLNL